jgi:hypothetical protein
MTTSLMVIPVLTPGSACATKTKSDSRAAVICKAVDLFSRYLNALQRVFRSNFRQKRLTEGVSGNTLGSTIHSCVGWFKARGTVSGAACRWS